MGALQRISKSASWLKLPKFQRSARGQAIEAAVREDEQADPYSYAMLGPNMTVLLVPLVIPATMVGVLIPATHGLPFLFTAATVGIAANARKLLFLRRLKKGVAQGPAVEALTMNRGSKEARDALEASTTPAVGSPTRFTSNEHLDY